MKFSVCISFVVAASMQFCNDGFLHEKRLLYNGLHNAYCIYKFDRDLNKNEGKTVIERNCYQPVWLVTAFFIREQQ